MTKLAGSRISTGAEAPEEEAVPMRSHRCLAHLPEWAAPQATRWAWEVSEWLRSTADLTGSTADRVAEAASVVPAALVVREAPVEDLAEAEDAAVVEAVEVEDAVAAAAATAARDAGHLTVTFPASAIGGVNSLRIPAPCLSTLQIRL